jgi:hypothetical protein
VAGSTRDRRLQALGLLFIVIASAFTSPFMIALRGTTFSMLASLLDPLYCEAFLSLALLHRLVLIAEAVGLQLEEVGEVLGIRLLPSAAPTASATERDLHFAECRLRTLQVLQGALLVRQGPFRIAPPEPLGAPASRTLQISGVTSASDDPEQSEASQLFANSPPQSHVPSLAQPHALSEPQHSPPPGEVGDDGVGPDGSFETPRPAHASPAATMHAASAAQPLQ